MESQQKNTTAFGNENEAVKEYYKFLLLRYYKNWYWFAIALAVSLTGAYLYLRYATPSYNVQASVLIKDTEQGGSAKESILQELDMFSPKKTVENEMEILKSRTLAEKVVDDLGLDVAYSVKGRLRNQQIFNEVPIRITNISPDVPLYKEPFAVVARSNGVLIDNQLYPYDNVVKTPYGLFRIQRRPAKKPINALTVQLLNRDQVVKGYVAALKVTQPRRFSNVLSIALENSVPSLGVAYISRLLYYYDLASLEDKNKVASNTLRFVDDRLKIISKELTSVEQNIQNYKTSAGIVDLSTESEVFLDKVKETDAQLNQVNIQLGSLKELEAYVQARSGRSSVVPATFGIEDPTLLGLIKQAMELELEREKLIKTLPETSGPVEAIDTQLRSTKLNIADNVQSMKKILISTQQKLTATNRKLEGIIRTVPAKERTLLDIARQQSIKNGLYTYLLQKREETALSYASTVSDLRLVDAPKADMIPVKPVPRFILILALVIGLIIPTAGIWLVDFFNNKVARKGQIEEVTKVPIIGEVVQAKIVSPLEISSKSRSILSEQIRSLRTNIQFFNTENEAKQTILVTSSISGEGKSFISLNLAASLSITERRVAVLELDLRKPKLHTYLNVTTRKGLSNYLVNQSTLDEIIYPVAEYPNLFFLPCGPIPPNPSELFTSARMRQLLEDLKESFDIIVIDTPPVGLVSDSLILAKHATMTLYIVRHMYTPKAYLKSIANLYNEGRFRNLALLINGIVPKKDYEYNYGYGGEYGYSYNGKYGYSSDQIDGFKIKD